MPPTEVGSGWIETVHLGLTPQASLWTALARLTPTSLRSVEAVFKCSWLRFVAHRQELKSVAGALNLKTLAAVVAEPEELTWFATPPEQRIHGISRPLYAPQMQ